MHRYYSRLTIIEFSGMERRKVAGEGKVMEDKAKSASAVMPILLGMARGLDVDEVNRATTDLQEKLPEADLRIIEGLSVLLIIYHKVGASKHRQEKALLEQ